MALRLCLRNQLMNDDAWRVVKSAFMGEEFREEIMDVAIGVVRQQEISWLDLEGHPPITS